MDGIHWPRWKANQEHVKAGTLTIGGVPITAAGVRSDLLGEREAPPMAFGADIQQN